MACFKNSNPSYTNGMVFLSIGHLYGTRLLFPLDPLDGINVDLQNPTSKTLASPDRQSTGTMCRSIPRKRCTWLKYSINMTKYEL